MNAPQPSPTFAQLSTFVRDSLPELNTACRDGLASFDTWLRCIRNITDGIETLPARLQAHEMLNLLQILGFILASAERHAQAHGHAPGHVLELLPGVEPALCAAAGHDRVPALTAELYWELNNSVPPLSFTREPHELFFISAVRTQTELRAVVNRHLRSLLDGGWSPSTAEGARLLRAAAAAMRQAHEQYLDFRRGPSGTPLMTPAQFNEMRVWLAPTVVAGRVLAGANAAYIPEMVVTDYLIGTADDAYDSYVRSFALYQSPRGRQLVEADRQCTPIVLHLAEALGLCPNELDSATPRALADRIRLAAPALRWSIDAFKELVGQLIGASGAHVGLVHVYLEKYARELSDEDLKSMPVRPTTGTGGHSHDHTRRIHDMRRHATRIRKLLVALKDEAPKEAA